MDWFPYSLKRFGRRASEARELNEDELRALLDSEIRETAGMSLPEFTAALEQGTVDPESPRLAGLAILLGARTS